MSALVSFNDTVLVFGGYSLYSEVNTVARFDLPRSKGQGQWTKLGKLNKNRSNHNAILFEHRVIIVGGLGNIETEIWNLEKNKSEILRPELNSYYGYPALFNVYSNYCKI